MRRIRRPSHATVVAYVALFIAISGGTTAVALSGSNTVFTDDIANDTFNSQTQGQGGLVAADLRPGSVGTSEIANGTVSVLDTNKVIPSGATVTGVLVGHEDNDSSITRLLIAADFYGLRAPTPLADTDINFDDSGLSAAAASPDETSTGCTGTIDTPTAPAGKVCIYLSDEGVTDGTADAQNLGQGTDSPTTMNDRGFKVEAFASSASGFANLHGTWAYRAP
jgi:hypothetical protein